MPGNHGKHSLSGLMGVPRQKLADLQRRLKPYRRLDAEVAKLIQHELREWRLSLIRVKGEG